MIAPVLLGVLIVAFAAHGASLSRHNSRVMAEQRAVFQRRDRLHLDDWSVRSFADTGATGEELAAVLQPVADAMCCDITQLRADDSFTGSLDFRGRAFLGCISDDDPLDDYFDDVLPGMIGDARRTDEIVSQLSNEPTLYALVLGVVRSRVGSV